MKKIVMIIFLALILAGSVATLALYNFGGLVIDSAIESQSSLAGNTEDAPSGSGSGSHEGNPPSIGSSSQKPENSTGGALPGGDALKPQSGGLPAAASEPDTSGHSDKSERTVGSAQQDAPVFSAKQAKKIEDSVTASDKISASALILSKLSSSDIKYLTGLLAGGLTAEEKAAAKKLCFERFSQEDIQKIYSLYKKYTAAK
ncbi:MAG: hypothetical protein Q8878_03250 [Bacillota bacterium]|nr:hypothetical protein [Bacillota bacterium]